MFVRMLCLEWHAALRRFLTLQLCHTRSVSAAFHNDDGTNQPRTSRTDMNLDVEEKWFWKTDTSYFKIYPLNQHFREVSDSTIVGNWKWLFVNGCECTSSIYAALISLNKCYKKKRHQCVWGLCWKIMLLQGNKWATLTVVMTCHLIFIIQHYCHHSYIYSEKCVINSSHMFLQAIAFLLSVATLLRLNSRFATAACTCNLDSRYWNEQDPTIQWTAQ
jgi:hypothetical protein